MKTNNENKYLFKRGNGQGFAFFLILLGCIYLLLNLKIIPIEYKPILISWQMLLIVIGIWTLLKRRFLGGILLITIGVFFIYPILCNIFPDFFISFDIDFKTYWPLLLIVFGLILISSRHFSSPLKCCKNEDKYDSGYYEYKATSKHDNIDFTEKNVMFGSTEQIVLSQNFRGGEANVMFGELIIDLRRAKLSETNGFFEVNVLFGSAVIYVPSDWNVELQGSSLFGSFDDKRYHLNNNEQDRTKSRLTIKGSALFGSGEIRN
ncbi:hypothetical protein JGH11_16545 [Dysgonomonas sp. Marseille-P4677]|uniref:LiaF transmembrane domain-containing protein n=1 Tax=Dysgonomonas sp. Marseille-P4677 TaxID=2364790 RepID=UPI001912521E|nr:LiaF domain-containing protein [Dysgonomonas sp. Marseille-P4677]MBK5722484.1 hypothetical protein [Dysgonomonas sp. Marseille-P4677]